MARIEGVEESKTSLLTRFVYSQARKRLGKVPEPLRVLAHHPTLFKGNGAFEIALERSRLVDHKLKALAEIKASTMVGCPFWMDIGSAVGRAAGVTEEQLRDMAAYKSSAAFSPLEKLVIEYAEEITKTPVTVSDEVFAALKQHFNEAQLVELTAAIAWENFRARFDHAFGIEAQGFSEGAYCVLPESVAVSNEPAAPRG